MGFKSALLAVSMLGATPALAVTIITPPPADVAPAAPVSTLVDAVNIPFERFTLPNGLRVLVHTDRKAPVVASSIWYHVGSKDEPVGKTGFAHLFEHIMFYGSQNAPGEYFKYMEEVGATDLNGTTWYDRTNYFQTAPTGALDRILFLESDRMGHLLGALTQAKLDVQRGVVQNEKRQGDNEPFGTVDYLRNSVLFPVGHPYRHDTIGSMADLNAASLDMVKDWFRTKYGPNNAVLVLAGDIDLATAKEKVTRYFGAIPRGPEVTRKTGAVTTLPAPVTRTMKDQVPYTRLYRTWVVEGVNGRDTTALDAAARVLGGLSSSRLDNALVRQEQLAVGVSASVQAHEDLGFLTITANVKPGVDAGRVGQRLDQLVADFLAKGPTADEVRRVATTEAAGTIRGFESVGGFGGKAVALAEGELYSRNPEKYKQNLRELAALTPASVQAAAQKWMSRPVFSLTVEAGPREDTPEMRAIRGDATSSPRFYAKTGDPLPRAQTAVDRSTLPPIAPLAALNFPAIERTTLSNGIQVVFARRPETPTVQVAVSFDAGQAADPKTAPGTQSLMLSLLDEGTTSRNSVQIAEEQERLGASISSGASLDRTTVGLAAVKPNLAASLGLLSDIVRNPAFAPDEVARLRATQLASIRSTLSQPQGLARYTLGPVLYGAQHPYGNYGRGVGDPAAVAKLTRDDLVRFHRDWIVPSKARIFVVGDTTLGELKPLLERSFGNWAEDRRGKPTKQLAEPVPSGGGRIYLVDRPGSPQSYIMGGQVLPFTGKGDLIAFKSAVEVLAGGLNNRLNDDLREKKSWAYGAGGGAIDAEGPMPFLAVAPVQTDRTGDSIAALISNITGFVGTSGVTPVELQRTVNGATRSLPGEFEQSGAVLSALQTIVLFGRPDDYYQRLPERYRTLTAAQLDQAARAALDPKSMRWVVVGDAKLVRPQLDKLGLPVEIVTPPVVQ